MKKSKRNDKGFPEFEWKDFFHAQCSCGGEGLSINPQYEDHSFEMSYWQQGLGGFHQMGFKKRIQWAWRILRKGTPYTDFVILNADDALKMSRYILDHYQSMREMWIEKSAQWKAEAEEKLKIRTAEERLAEIKRNEKEKKV